MHALAEPLHLLDEALVDQTPLSFGDALGVGDLRVQFVLALNVELVEVVQGLDGAGDELLDFVNLDLLLLGSLEEYLVEVRLDRRLAWVSRGQVPKN